MGIFIKELRENKKWTQEELARKIPISRGAVSKWECGKAYPDILVLKELSKLFKVSIEELLSGERNPKNNIALELYKDRNNNIKKLKVVLSIIIISIILFLSYYFINQYQSINIFTIQNDGELFNISNGLFIKTQEKTYFNLGEITSKENIEISKLELYYGSVSNENSIYITTKNSILFYDYAGYEEYIPNDKLKNIINNLYLKIYYNDTYEIIKLNFVKDYENDSLLFLKVKNISKKSQEKSKLSNNNIDLSKIPSKFLEQDNYYYFQSEYNKQDIEIIYLPNENLISLQFMKNNEITEEYIYNIITNSIDYYTYQNSILKDFLSTTNCNTNDCEDYEKLKNKTDIFFDILNDILY